MNVTMHIEKAKKHILSWCSVCGWVHKPTELIRQIENGKLVKVPICKDCQDKMESVVKCFFCGVKTGDKLFYTPVEYRKYNNESCVIFLCLCEDCKKTMSHEKILKNIKLPDTICDGCEKKFICYTEQHEVVSKSYKDTTTGFYKGLK